MKWTRRDIIKGLGGLPIAGAIWWAGAASSVQSSKERSKLLEQLNIEASLSKVLPPIGGAPVRVGIIGFGIRGEQLCRSLGFATRDWLDNMAKAAKENPNHSALADFNSQGKGKEKGMTFIYSATLGNSFSRPTILMGHDATFLLGSTNY